MSAPIGSATGRDEALVERRVWLMCLLSLLGALICPAASGQSLYRYVDEEGRVHFVDSPSKVPASRRSTASELTADPGHVPLAPAPSEAPAADVRAPRIDPSDASGSRSGVEACRLVFRNRRSRVEGTKTIYSGEVVNAGTGIARGVEVAFIDYDAADRVMDRRTVTPIPSTLASREAGAFTIEMKTVERTAAKTQARFARTAFEASFVRCD